MPQPRPRRLEAANADLDMLASVLDGDPNRSEGGYLDLTTGETWSAFVFEEDDDFDPDDDCWYYVPCEGSHSVWHDMRIFIDEQVSDSALAARLSDAVTGRGAFRRFGDVLHDHDDIRYSWLRFKDERARERARQWLLDEGLRDPDAGVGRDDDRTTTWRRGSTGHH